MVGFLLGFLTGWLVFKQPEKFKEFVDKVTAKVKEVFSKVDPSK